MERAKAQQLLGVPEGAAEDVVTGAYWRLRGHIEAREDAASTDAERRLRADELVALERARVALAPVAGSSNPAPASRLSPMLLATSALLLLGLVGAWLWLRGGPATPAIAAVPPPPPAPAVLTAVASLEGAQLRVVRAEDGEEVAAGAADGSPYTLEPGAYAVEVAHADCPEPWRRDVDLAPGEQRQLAPQPCAETGWVVVRSNVGGDQLEIDGQPVGSTGPERHAVSAGEHHVRVTKPGREAWQGRVVVVPGEELALRADLAPAQQRQSTPTAEPDARDPRAPEIDDDWHARVRGWLLARYDDDGSGSLDTEAEIRRVPCDRWRAFERSYDQSGLALPMTRIYGFDGSDWVDGALGIDPRMRGFAYARMKECGLR